MIHEIPDIIIVPSLDERTRKENNLVVAVVQNYAYLIPTIHNSIFPRVSNDGNNFIINLLYEPSYIMNKWAAFLDSGKDRAEGCEVRSHT